MLEDGVRHLLIAGVTTRALAVSAVRAGWRVTAVDAFGDLDLRAVATVASAAGTVGKRFSPAAAARAARGVTADAVAYTSNFENHPEAVASLARGRQLLGNTPDVLEQIRNPLILMRALRRRGFAVPDTRASAPPFHSSERWLTKPRRSGGGHGTSLWQGDPVRRSAYLQARIRGTPGSISFLADGRHSVPIGLSLQLVGEAAFGARGFKYCGSLLAGGKTPLFHLAGEVAATAAALAAAVTEEFGLVGLNGLDFIARDGVPFPIEVNPRYSASMELVERALPHVSLFRLHERACGGLLPSDTATPRHVAGKSVVFSRRAVMIGDTSHWAADGIADIPHPGDRIGRGHPICTVFAEGRDARECRERLVRKAARIYRAVAPPARGAA